MIQHLCRQGDLSAGALQQRFALALDAEAPGMFLELAQLLPSAQQRSDLLAAAQQAGWAAYDDAKSVGTPEVRSQPSACQLSIPGALLDRSRGEEFVSWSWCMAFGH